MEYLMFENYIRKDYMPNPYRDFVRAHAGQGLSLKQIAEKWQASKTSKAQRGGAGAGLGASDGVVGQDPTIYVGMIGNDPWEILIITHSMQRAIDAVNNARQFPNWYQADMGLVVQTELDDQFPDGLPNEHPVFQVQYDEHGNATPVPIQ
jgi:hypothetical protein